MSKFFNKQSAHVKQESVAKVRGNKMLGDSMSFWSPLHKGNTLVSQVTQLAQDIITSQSAFHDYRCLIELHKKASYNWARRNSAVATGLSERDLALCHFVVNMFCKWNGQKDNAGGLVEYSLLTFQRDILSLWRNTPAGNQNAFATTFIGKLTPVIINDVISSANIPYLFDLGLSAVTPKDNTLMDEIKKGLAGTKNITVTGVVPTDLASLANEFNDNLDLPSLFLYHETQRNLQDTLGFFTSAICLLVTCIVKDQPPTDHWVNSRNSRLANSLGIPTDLIEYSAECTELIKTMVTFRGLTVVDYSTLLLDVYDYCTTMDIQPLLWSLDQAAYTGLTIITTMIDNLASYPDMPWGLLFMDVESELTTFLKACMYAYRFPYHGLRNVVYPATKFPNIATAAIQIAMDQGKRTYAQYKGKYVGAQMAKYQGIINTYASLSSATLSHDALAHALPAIFGPVQSYKILRGNLVCQIGGQTQTAPAPQTILNAASGSWDDANNTFTVSLSEVFRLIKDHHIANASEVIKVLYSSVSALQDAFQESPIVHKEVTRDVPTTGSLVALANLTEAVNMTW